MYNEWVKDQEILITAYFEFTTYGNDDQAKQSIERLQKHLKLWNPTIRIKGARLRGLTDQPIRKRAKDLPPEGEGFFGPSEPTGGSRPAGITPAKKSAKKKS